MREKNAETRIRELSLLYTPEWRFSGEQPDLGSGLALLFATFMSETYEQLDSLLELQEIQFFNCLDTSLKPGTNAFGYLTFALVNPDMPPAVVPKGTGVTAVSESGQKIEFETAEETAVSPSRAEPEPYYGEGEIYIRFTLPLMEPVQSLLAIVEAGIHTPGRSLSFEYESAGHFLPMAVEDKTEQLTETGIIRFMMPPAMTEAQHFGKSGYWLKIRNRGKDVPFPVVRFYLNGARVLGKSGLQAGNLPAFTDFKLMKTIGFVSEIRNPDVLYGGTEGETGEEAIKSRSAAIKHLNQAVTPGDFEALIGGISLNIERVTCFSGLNGSGDPAPGFVTAVVLQKDYEKGRKYFYRLREELMEGLRGRISPCLAEGGRLEIISPWLVLIEVDVTVATEGYDRVFELKKRVEESIEVYLNPVTGGYDKKGWAFGCLPERTQIRHMLERIEGVTYVKRLGMTVSLEVMGTVTEQTYDSVKNLPFVLPYPVKPKVGLTMA